MTYHLMMKMFAKDLSTHLLLSQVFRPPRHHLRKVPSPGNNRLLLPTQVVLLLTRPLLPPKIQTLGPGILLAKDLIKGREKVVERKEEERATRTTAAGEKVPLSVMDILVRLAFASSIIKSGPFISL